MKTIRICIRSVILIAITLMALEAALTFIDPLGVVYYRDIRTIENESKRQDLSGYTFASSHKTHLTKWSFETTPDGTRSVPGISLSGPKVRFYGDSVTFGMGVDDANTWVSIVCSSLHLNCTNYGRGGYPASNTVELMQATAHRGCAVFLTIHNDMETMDDFIYGNQSWRPMILDYWHFLTVGRYAGYARLDNTAYQQAMQYAASRPNTLLLAFDGHNYGKMVREQYGAVLIPNFTSRISVVDTHPNNEGNRQIAEYILPILDEWLDERNCT